MSWYFKVLKNYVNFSGRARRKEYWFFILFHYIITFALMFLGVALNADEFSQIDSSGSDAEWAVLMMAGPLFWIYTLATILPALAVTIRRLHDTDRSGWFILINFVPYVGGIILFIFMVLEGSPGRNRFGADPLDENGEDDYYGYDDDQYDRRSYRSRQGDERGYDDRRYDDRRYDNRQQDDRRYDDRRYDNRQQDDRRYDDRRPDNRQQDDRRYDDRRSDNRQQDDRRYDDRRSDNRQQDDRGYDDRRQNERPYNDTQEKDAFNNQGNPRRSNQDSPYQDPFKNLQDTDDDRFKRFGLIDEEETAEKKPAPRNPSSKDDDSFKA